MQEEIENIFLFIGENLVFILPHAVPDFFVVMLLRKINILKKFIRCHAAEQADGRKVLSGQCH